MNNYSQYSSKQWRDKRNEIEAKNRKTCQHCGARKEKGKVRMHIHHINYDKTKDLWSYPDDNFLCLCGGCHEWAHQSIDKFREALGIAIKGKYGSDVLSPFEGLAIDLISLMENNPKGIEELQITAYEIAHREL